MLDKCRVIPCQLLLWTVNSPPPSPFSLLEAGGGISSGVPADDGMAKLWKALLDEKFTFVLSANDNEAGMDVVKLKDGLGWADGESCDTIKLLFARKGTKAVCELALASKRKIVLVKGTPGIGKTVGGINYSLLLLASKIREGLHTEPVIVDFMKNGRRYALFPSGDVIFFINQAGKPTPQPLNRTSVIQFIDPGESNRELILNDNKLIEFTSPFLGNYKVVNKTSGGPDVFYMYPLDIAELHVLQKREWLVDNQGEVVSEDVIEERFGAFGGSLRRILDIKRNNVGDALVGLNEDLMREARLFAQVKDKESAASREVVQLSHRRYHEMPPEDPIELYHDFSPLFASKVIENGVAALIRRSKLENQRKYWSEFPFPSGAVGAVFENRFHMALTGVGISGVYFNVLRKENLAGLVTKRAETADLQVLIPKLLLENFEGESELLELAVTALKKREAVLLVPTNQNFEEVDSFSLFPPSEGSSSGWVLWMNQVTVAKEYKYSPAVINKYRNTLKTALDAASEEENLPAVTINFVTIYQEGLLQNFQGHALKYNKGRAKYIEEKSEFVALSDLLYFMPWNPSSGNRFFKKAKTGDICDGDDGESMDVVGARC